MLKVRRSQAKAHRVLWPRNRYILERLRVAARLPNGALHTFTCIRGPRWPDIALVLLLGVCQSGHCAPFRGYVQATLQSSVATSSAPLVPSTGIAQVDSSRSLPQEPPAEPLQVHQ